MKNKKLSNENLIIKIKSKKYYKQILDLNLIDVTTIRQSKNGTFCFKDNSVNFELYYAVYKSGYIRRIIIYSPNYIQLGGFYNPLAMYQLNPRKNIKDHNNKIIAYERIVFPYKYKKLMKLLINPINSFRIKHETKTK